MIRVHPGPPRDHICRSCLDGILVPKHKHTSPHGPGQPTPGPRLVKSVRLILRHCGVVTEEKDQRPCKSGPKVPLALGGGLWRIHPERVQGFGMSGRELGLTGDDMKPVGSW